MWNFPEEDEFWGFLIDLLMSSDRTGRKEEKRKERRKKKERKKERKTGMKEGMFYTHKVWIYINNNYSTNTGRLSRFGYERIY